MLLDDSYNFYFSIKPKDVTVSTNIPLKWEFKSRNFISQGILKISIIPQFTEKEEIVIVTSQTDFSEPIVKITPRIEVC